MDPEEILSEVLSVLKELKIDIYKVNLSTLRIKIKQYITSYPLASQTRAVLEIADEVSKLYGDLSLITVKNRKPTSMDVILFDDPNPYRITKTLNPRNLYKKAYVALDGMKATLSNNNTKISWEISNTQSNMTQVRNKFRDVVEIKLLSSSVTFNLPVYTSTQITTVLIEELKSQSFISPDRNFHFVTYDKLDTTEINRISQAMFSMYNPTLRKLVVDNSCHDAIYAFDPPITTLSTITLSFGRPTKLCTIGGQGTGSSCLVNLEITYIEPTFNPEDV